MTILPPMPMYEYRCESCDKTHEVIQKFADAPLSQCPECSAPVSKVMSLCSFSLKGSGWYSTDYKKGSTSSASKASDTQSAPKAEACSTGAACGTGAGCSN